MFNTHIYKDAIGYSSVLAALFVLIAAAAFNSTDVDAKNTTLVEQHVSTTTATNQPMNKTTFDVIVVTAPRLQS